MVYCEDINEMSCYTKVNVKIRIDKTRCLLMRKYPFKFLVSCVICASVFVGASAQAKLFKWKDENGQIHYGDRIPARYLNKERQELNNQGAVIGTVDRALTAEESAEKRKQEVIAEKKAKELAEQKKRDRVLIDTYTTERDLIIARAARIDAVNSQIQLSESIIGSAIKKLERTKKQIEAIKARNRDVPEHIYTKLDREKQQLATHNKVANNHKKNREAIKKQFDGYIVRFSELLAMKAERRKAAEERRQAAQY